MLSTVRPSAYLFELILRCASARLAHIFPILQSFRIPHSAQILSHTGAIALALVALSVLRWVWSYFLTSSDLSRYGAKKGAWAVVTGASDGIGKVRAAALAF
jgi:hypothetical protein